MTSQTWMSVHLLNNAIWRGWGTGATDRMWRPAVMDRRKLYSPESGTKPTMEPSLRLVGKHQPLFEDSELEDWKYTIDYSWNLVIAKTTTSELNGRVESSIDL